MDKKDLYHFLTVFQPIGISAIQAHFGVSYTAAMRGIEELKLDGKEIKHDKAGKFYLANKGE